MQALSLGLLPDIIERLVKEFRPEQIVLFGSYAWGRPDSDSDLDLLVIVPQSDLSPTRRAARAHRCLQGLNVSKDVLVRTRAEVERFRHVPASLEHQILTRGTILYERHTGTRTELAHQSPA